MVNKRRRGAKRDKKKYTYALSAIEAKARMVGMTYGKYVAKNNI